MLSLPDIEQALEEYTAWIVPAMLRRHYHLSLVKGGPEYPDLPEQSHFSHIINGVLGLAQLARYIVAEQIAVPGLDADTFRKALALFTIHDVHKDRAVELLGPSEFSVPIERLQEEYDALGLQRFGEIGPHLMRAANVHKRSPKHGDLLLDGDPRAHRLWLLVRIADTIGSARSPAEAVASLRGYLSDLAPSFAAKSPPGRYALYYHELQDVRGVLSNVIHQSVQAQLQTDLGLHPLLYFPTGAAFIGPAGAKTLEWQAFADAVITGILSSLVQKGDVGEIRDAIRRPKFDFQPYVYAFATIEDLLTVVRDETLTSKPDPQLAASEIDKEVSKRGAEGEAWRSTVQERFGISLLDPREHRSFNEIWSQARRYLLYVDALLRDLSPETDRFDWLLRTFAVPQQAGESLRQEAAIWSRGGLGKYVLVIAYHFLRGEVFRDRAAESLPPEQVVERLHTHVLTAMRGLDTQAGRQAAVAGLGFREALNEYLSEHLTLSFAATTRHMAGTVSDYAKVKRKGHTSTLCSLCNRHSRHTQPLRTGTLGDFGRVFSNRVLPAPEAPGHNRLWCPVCQLEFILRKLAGVGLPAGAHYKNSYRLHLYVLPAFSFTPDHLRIMEPLLKEFRRTTNLPVRDYGADWGLPRYWLERRTFDPQWTDDLQQVLEREAAKIEQRGGQAFVGERASLARAAGQPHYYLIVWEKAARETGEDDARIATRTEAWTKACFAAAVISGLTSCRVYVTERAFLPVPDPAEVMATITLDSPPPALRALLPTGADTVSLYGRERGQRSSLERFLDLSAALWTVTADVHRRGQTTKDKHVSGRLAKVNSSPLAGATFYKEFGRLNEWRSPYPPLRRACQVLLAAEIQDEGGQLMDLVERIAGLGLQIALPLRRAGRGKAHTYELLFREAVSAMRKAQGVIPEMRQAAISGQPPSEQSIAELKGLTAGTLLKMLERRGATGRGEIYIRARGDALARLVGELVDTLVDDLYLGRANAVFARFLRLENTVADGIYYYTDRNLSRLWQEHREQRAAAALQAEDKEA